MSSARHVTGVRFAQAAMVRQFYHGQAHLLSESWFVHVGRDETKRLDRANRLRALEHLIFLGVVGAHRDQRTQ